MADDELEEIRRRKLQQLQDQAADEENQQAAQQDFEARKQAILRQILEPEARERLTRVRMARPEVAQSLEEQLILLAQQGRIRQKIDDDTLKQFLSRLSPSRREINIERR